MARLFLTTHHSPLTTHHPPHTNIFVARSGNGQTVVAFAPRVERAVAVSQFLPDVARTWFWSRSSGGSGEPDPANLVDP
jgi:hypothetical protein